MATRSGIVKPKKRPDGRWEAKVTVGYKEDGKLDRKSIYGHTKREVEEKMLKLLSDKVGEKRKARKKANEQAAAD